jgi:hypothetical protein
MCLLGSLFSYKKELPHKRQLQADSARTERFLERILLIKDDNRLTFVLLTGDMQSFFGFRFKDSYILPKTDPLLWHILGLLQLPILPKTVPGEHLLLQIHLAHWMHICLALF